MTKLLIAEARESVLYLSDFINYLEKSIKSTKQNRPLLYCCSPSKFLLQYIYSMSKIRLKRGVIFEEIGISV